MNKELQEVNENLLRYISELILYIDDYKSRCEKAIEYIKDNCSYEEDTKYCYDDLCSSDVNDLLSILQNGSDKE